MSILLVATQQKVWHPNLTLHKAIDVAISKALANNSQFNLQSFERVERG